MVLEITKFHSNGKLLLTGEYLVLHGALALAVPTRFGQSLEVSEMPGLPFIHWTGRIKSESWFDAEFSLPELEIIKTNDPEIASNLKAVLKLGKKIKSSNFNSKSGYKINTDLDFDINWGLGSSSSLLSNIAYWLDIDPFELYFGLYSGSGFDVACARSRSPLLYRLDNKLPVISTHHFLPPFRDKLFFIYQGKKQNSERSVYEYLSKDKPGRKLIERITALTNNIATTHSLEEFEFFIREHEEIISGILKQTRIKNSRFPDFPGEMKSLGAWGGDFIMVSWDGEFEALRSYFHKHGLNVIFPYSEIILGDKKIS